MWLDEDRVDQIERRLKHAESRLLAYPWKDWPPDRVTDLVQDLRAVLDHCRELRGWPPRAEPWPAPPPEQEE